MASKQSSAEQRDFSSFEAEILADLKSGKSLAGVEGTLTKLIKHVIERAMDAELSDHLTDEVARLGAGANKRNGKRAKRINTDFGPTVIEPSRDRAGSYDSQIVGKWQHDLAPNLSEQILSLYARGNSQRDISKHIHEMFGHVLSAGSISQVVDSVWQEVQTWQKRALQACYVAIFMDAIHFKVRLEGKSTSVAVYLFYGVDVSGQRDILSMHVSQGAESTSQWAVYLQDLQQRGVSDVKVFIADGLSGLVDAVGVYFPKADFQRCIVHKVRNSVVGVDYKDRKAVCRDLRQVYTAPDAEAAEQTLIDFEAKWTKYPHIGRLWRKDWTELMVFMDFGPEMRRLIYTTNALENVNRHLRKATKSKGSWTTQRALNIQVYLTLKVTKQAWSRRVFKWAAVQRELIERYGEDYLQYVEV